jgi:Dyp-type peroxidase family
MTTQLDLMDIQGNLLRAYGRFSFPVARYVFLRVYDGKQGRKFVGDLTKIITTAANWGSGPNEIEKPTVTTNIAFTYTGLKALELPRASLAGFPPEFAMGMKDRQDILGDDGPSAPVHWDKAWHGEPVHMFVSINAQQQQYLEIRYGLLSKLIEQYNGAVQIVHGHRSGDGIDLAYQDANIVVENGEPTSKEHFGYTDGIGDAVFEGLPVLPERVLGRGKQIKDGWLPLATGEFILGHLDEAREYPAAPAPFLLSRNGAFMVYRKLHQNVGSFNAYLEKEGANYPGGKDLLAAKFMGRWQDNGAPLANAPDVAKKQAWDARFAQATENEQDAMLSNFTFDDDPSGAKCPFSAHMRRINPRASLQQVSGAFDTPGALSDRRRILRRGLPYGEVKDKQRDDGNHGIIIMMIGASISRQFEFVQQQWINYGNDFRAGNDKEIILGNHSVTPSSKAVIQVDPDGDNAPYFLQNIPRFVETRGGDYFFLPSMTALRMIAQGRIDPT